MFGTCVQPMGLLVYITRTAVACPSGVIASLFMVACRQQRLISGFNGAACDSGSKYLCSISLIRPLLRNGETPERERGVLSWASGWQQQLNAPSSPVVISHTGPGRRAIYCLWWKGVCRGGLLTLDRCSGRKASVVYGIETRDEAKWQRLWILGSDALFHPWGALKQSESLFLPWHCLCPCMCISPRVHDYLCVCTGMWALVCACVRVWVSEVVIGVWH